MTITTRTMLSQQPIPKNYRVVCVLPFVVTHVIHRLSAARFGIQQLFALRRRRVSWRFVLLNSSEPREISRNRAVSVGGGTHISGEPFGLRNMGKKRVGNRFRGVGSSTTLQSSSLKLRNPFILAPSQSQVVDWNARIPPSEMKKKRTTNLTK